MLRDRGRCRAATEDPWRQGAAQRASSMSSRVVRAWASQPASSVRLVETETTTLRRPSSPGHQRLHTHGAGRPDGVDVGLQVLPSVAGRMIGRSRRRGGAAHRRHQQGSHQQHASPTHAGPALSIVCPRDTFHERKDRPPRDPGRSCYHPSGSAVVPLQSDGEKGGSTESPWVGWSTPPNRGGSSRATPGRLAKLQLFVMPRSRRGWGVGRPGGPAVGPPALRPGRRRGR
jgi:hypothetical protein